MTRGMLWAAAFAAVAVFTFAGARFDDDGQRNVAVISTIAFIGLAVIIGVYFAINGLQRIRNLWQRLKPRAFRRR
jgi:hypothetical protein